MKKLALTAAFALFFLPLLHAQTTSAAPIAGTIWKGTFLVPDPLQCLLRFKKDTLEMLYAGDTQIQSYDGSLINAHDSAVLESMSYSQHGDTLQLQKVLGGSPCTENQVGNYLLRTTNGKLNLVTVKDPCQERTYAFKGELTQLK